MADGKFDGKGGTWVLSNNVIRGRGAGAVLSGLYSLVHVPMPTEWLMIDIQLMINSITLVTPTFDPVGIAFDPVASLINHSCDPNSVMTFDGRSLSVRALREIAKDEELTISYIDNTNPTHRRQDELTERYFFKCECTRCTSYAESQDPREAFACPSPSCDGWFNGKIVNDGDDTCKKCGVTMPRQFNSPGLLAMEDQGWAVVNG